jgi:citronellol/citronellal dehydrogenase
MTPDPALLNTPEAIWNADTVYRADLFKGKVALVSGGGSGIGRAVALLFARLGASVVICGRTAEKLDAVVAFARARGATMLAVPTNVREPEQVDALFQRIHSEFGRLDCTVNNAGGQYPQAAIDYAPKGWAAVINNNLNGSWYMMQRAAQYWREHPLPAGQSASIVNVVVVIERGMPGVAHTVAARAGIIGASRTVAVEWAPLAIRVNCVAPGLSVYPPEAVREFPLANPLKRPGTALEIAEGCIYLSAGSGSFITGEVLTIDGGGKLWGELWTAGRPDWYKLPT